MIKNERRLGLEFRGLGLDFLELAGFHYEKALKEMIEIEAQ